MNTFTATLSRTQYSFFRLSMIVLLYVAYMLLTYSTIMSYFHPMLRMINVAALLMLVALTFLFAHYCPKR